MAFLAPLFLVGLLAAAIPLVLHLFHRRPEPVIEFAAVRYLRRAPADHARRRRLRELVLLALRATALLLLAVAFARPYFDGAAVAGTGGTTVVLVDTSASLSAPGQFERARARAAEAVRAAPATHAVGLVAFGASVDVVAPPSADRATATAAVAALRPGAGATRYRTALGRAAELLEGRPGRLVVVTDLQESGWEAGHSIGVPEAAEVVIDDIGAPPGNLAVTALRLDGGQAVAVVQNFSSEPVKEQVTFTRDGRPVGAVMVALPANGSVDARIPFVPAGTAPQSLAATVGDRAGYAADNARYTIANAVSAPAVLAVTASGQPSESFFLERAVTVADADRGFRFVARGGPAFAAMRPGDLAAFDVVAILGTRGIDRRGRDLLAGYVRSGGGLLLTAGPDVDPAVLQTVLKDVVHTTWSPGRARAVVFAPDDSRHPVFRAFGGAGTLGDVTFRRTAAVTAPAGAVVVARYSDGTPALVEERVGDGRLLVFASDLNDRWNDFPLQPAFVPFVHELLHYLAAPRARRSEYLVGELPVAAGRSPGVISHAGRSVAVNVDVRESDPRPMTGEAFLAGVERLHEAAASRAGARVREREDGQRLWQIVLLLMAATLAVEGVLGRRAA